MVAEMNDRLEAANPEEDRESISELFGQLASDSAAVVHNEIELVIQGIREKTRAVRSGLLLVMAGTLTGFAAFMALCAALIIGLTAYMSPVAATLATGAGLAIAGIAVACLGYRRLKNSLHIT